MQKAGSKMLIVVADGIKTEIKTMVARDPMTTLSTKSSLKDDVFMYIDVLEANGETIAQKIYDAVYVTGDAQAMREQTPKGGVRLYLFPCKIKCKLTLLS